MGMRGIYIYTLQLISNLIMLPIGDFVSYSRLCEMCPTSKYFAVAGGEQYTNTAKSQPAASCILCTH